jgi:hypothetical protein
MFFGYKTPLKKEKYFINLGCSHAAAFEMPVEESYPYLLAKKFDIGYYDYAYPRTSIDYAKYVLNTNPFKDYEFILWQLTYPWRKHNWEAQNRDDARLDNVKDITLNDSFNLYANLLHTFKNDNVYFFFINQPYVDKYISKLCKINPKTYYKNINFLDYGSDKFHGGKETQIFISNTMYEFINYDKTN